MKYYDARLCLPRLEFEDAPILNKSGIVRNIFCEKTLKPLLYITPTDALYCFYGKSVLFSVITDILASKQKSKKKNTKVQNTQKCKRKKPKYKENPHCSRQIQGEFDLFAGCLGYPARVGGVLCWCRARFGCRVCPFRCRRAHFEGILFP